jgi:hypothetical protein
MKGASMYLTDLYDPWHRGVVDRLRDARQVLDVLGNTATESSETLAIATYHLDEAISLLEIGTEELHTIQGAGVGRFHDEEAERWLASVKADSPHDAA